MGPTGPSPVTATYLDRIVARRRYAALADNRQLEPLLDWARAAVALQDRRDFAGALVDANGIAVVAEVKRRTPTNDRLAVGLDPGGLARAYEAGGAAAISVLTDAEFFGGSVDDLLTARCGVAVPVLRKDFTLGPRDVCDARIMGADAILLIAAILDTPMMVDLAQLAAELQLDVVVEVHNVEDLERAMAIGPTIIGVNRRDLATFEISTSLALTLASLIPAEVVKVAESGVNGHADALALHDAGFDAVLVGELFVTATDPARAVRRLRQAPHRTAA